jgi:hypothetical protein
VNNAPGILPELLPPNNSSCLAGLDVAEGNPLCQTCNVSNETAAGVARTDTKFWHHRHKGIELHAAVMDDRVGNNSASDSVHDDRFESQLGQNNALFCSFSFL